jgi:predicted P-loop ATPase
LKDSSGARRFNPIHVGVTGPIDIEGLTRDRDLLWAEARIMYGAGIPWWFTAKQTEVAALAQAEQDERYQRDAWEDLISNYLDSKLHSPPEWPAYQVTIDQIFKQCLEFNDKSRWDQGAANRVARVLARLGWRRVRGTIKTTVQGEEESKRVWRYERSATPEELAQNERSRPADNKASPSNVHQLPQLPR